MHAGCRRRNADEGQVAGTGSEVLQPWGCPDACPDPHLLRSPLVAC